MDVARLLWPRFVVREGAVLVADFIGEQSAAVPSFPSLTEAEIALNHVHILECFENSAILDGDPFYDRDHPDFQHACALGIVVAQSWASKLRADFPERAFLVYYTEEDNPIVRFHQLREGEPHFLDGDEWAEEVDDGRVVIHHVNGTG